MCEGGRLLLVVVPGHTCKNAVRTRTSPSALVSAILAITVGSCNTSAPHPPPTSPHQTLRSMCTAGGAQGHTAKGVFVPTGSVGQDKLGAVLEQWAQLLPHGLRHHIRQQGIAVKARAGEHYTLDHRKVDRAQQRLHHLVIKPRHPRGVGIA